jgi:hypothetical protein
MHPNHTPVDRLSRRYLWGVPKNARGALDLTPRPKTGLLNPMNRCATVREVEYALARQLDQAGFPPAGKGTWTGPADHLTWRRTDLVYQPTLDELIAAVRAIEPSITLQCAGDVWIACVVYEHFERYGEGPSAADAVATLWLLLQQLIATASPDGGARL